MAYCPKKYNTTRNTKKRTKVDFLDFDFPTKRQNEATPQRTYGF